MGTILEGIDRYLQELTLPRVTTHALRREEELREVRGVVGVGRPKVDYIIMSHTISFRITVYHIIVYCIR